MMLDPQADLGRRAWLPCPYCHDNAPLYRRVPQHHAAAWACCGVGP